MFTCLHYRAQQQGKSQGVSPRNTAAYHCSQPPQLTTAKLLGRHDLSDSIPQSHLLLIFPFLSTTTFASALAAASNAVHADPVLGHDFEIYELLLCHQGFAARL